nr:hypothetical protein [Rhodothalassium salexigens]
MTAALACAEALGLDTRVCADLLPAVEAGMVRGINAHLKQDGS